MKTTIDTFLNRFRDVVDTVQGLAKFVRGKEFHESSILALEELVCECTAHKDCAITEQMEEYANAFLAFEFMAKALIEEFRFYLALKRDEPSAAWDHLIDAQSAATCAMKSHAVASHLDGKYFRPHKSGQSGIEETNSDYIYGGYIGKLHLLEKLLFPPPVFLSPGIVVKESECSICGSDYGNCDHITGRPYMGKLCEQIVKAMEVLEVSMVSSPASKHARVLGYPDESGAMRDFFSWRIVSDGDLKQTNGE